MLPKDPLWHGYAVTAKQWIYRANTLGKEKGMYFYEQ